MNACPVIPAGDTANLATALAAIDCQLNTAVGIAYARLFGHGGSFALVLTALLTIYIALLALGLIGGRARLSLSSAMPRVLALGLVLTFATAWPAYQTVVTGLLARGPDQIASAILGGNGGNATQVFAQRLDGLFGSYVELAQALQAQGKDASANLQLSARLAWSGALLLVLSTAGLLVMVRVVLAILLALGPVFIVLALFRGSRGLFEGWLKTVVAFALAPLLLVLGGSGVIALLSPLLQEAMNDPIAAGEAVRPLAMLFVAAVVYVLTLLGLFWAALNLTRNWRSSRAGASAADPVNADGPHPQERRQPPHPRNVERGSAPNHNEAPATRALGIASALGRSSMPERSRPAAATLVTAATGNSSAPLQRLHNTSPRWSRNGPRAATRQGASPP